MEDAYLRYHALVVDDTREGASLLTMVLKTTGRFEIQQARDGMDALEKVRSTKFDIILTDLQMPRLDGLRLITALRRNPAHRSIPVVVVSARGPDDEGLALNIGADACVSKPIQARQVIDTVNRLLGIGGESAAS